MTDQFIERCKFHKDRSKLSKEYQGKDLKGKSAMLDELCQRTGYNRSHLNKILRGTSYRSPAQRREGRGRKRYEYRDDTILAFRALQNHMFGVSAPRLKAMVPHILSSGILKDIVPWFHDGIGAEMLKISEDTLRTRLSAVGDEFDLSKLSEKNGDESDKLRDCIPISSRRSPDSPIGTMEADTVQHKSNSGADRTCWTLHAVCVASGWSERVAMSDRKSSSVVSAMDELIQRLPFEVLSVHTDNGKEFINNEFHGFLVDRGIKMTRGRPRHSNDNPLIERLNSCYIRKFIGFDTYRSEEERRVLQEIHDILSLIINFFLPGYRRLDKGKGKDELKTPLDRLVDLFRESNKDLPEEVEKMLTLRDSLDMLRLYEKLHNALAALKAIRSKRSLPPRKKEEIDS